MQNNCFDYPAQLLLLFLNTKISIPKKLKNKTLSTGVPKHPGAHFLKIKINYLVLRIWRSSTKKVIEFPLKKMTIF
jgi:hypothetical protein